VVNTFEVCGSHTQNRKSREVQLIRWPSCT